MNEVSVYSLTDPNNDELIRLGYALREPSFEFETLYVGTAFNRLIRNGEFLQHHLEQSETEHADDE